MSQDTYSPLADEQLNELENGTDPDLYNAILDACELILHHPAMAQALSSAITTKAGIRFRLPVSGYSPWKVFWTSDGPRINAILRHP